MLFLAEWLGFSSVSTSYIFICTSGAHTKVDRFPCASLSITQGSKMVGSTITTAGDELLMVLNLTVASSILIYVNKKTRCFEKNVEGILNLR